MSREILVVGSGSVGQRHARNLAALGARIHAVDPRADRRETMAGEVALQSGHDSVAAALASGRRFDAGVVASPTAFHVDQALALLDREVPVLLEKPVAPDLASALRLRERVRAGPAPLLLGYTWRWWRPLARVRRMLERGEIGAVRWANFVMSAHLADWHPWEPYQDWFMASAEQGGGALLDESHWVDLMLWLFGRPAGVVARVEHVSELEITSDDHVDLLVDFEDGPRVQVHLDLYGRPHEKSIRLVGEKGTLLWTADPNRVSIGREAAPSWEHTDFEGERNDMFVAVAHEFVDVVEGRSRPSCTIDDGVRALEVLEAARQSHREERRVRLDENPAP